MKNLLLFIVIFLSVYWIVNADYYEDNKTFCSTLDWAKLIADDWTYIWMLSSSKYESDSISNKYWNYWSKYNSDSIFNKYWSYWSKYNSYSPWNKYSSNWPLILKWTTIYWRLTLNKYAEWAINPFSAIFCFMDVSDDRLEPFLELLDTTASSISYTPINNISATICWLNSSDAWNWKCQCDTWYTWQDPNDSKNFDCVKKKTYTEMCQYQYWANTYWDEKNCYCNSWYVWNTNKTACIKYESKCWLNSYSTTDWKCQCDTWYTWQDPNDSKNFDCIKKKTYTEMCQEKYWIYSYWDEKYCYCNSWYIWNSNKTTCVKEVVKTPDQLCKESYWNYSISTWKQNSDWTYNCTCKTEYIWNPNQTSCIKEIKIEENKIETYNLPDNLIEKLDIIFDKIKKSKSNLSNEEKIDYYKKLQLQLENLYLKQKKDQNKNIINYLKDLVKKEIIY